MGKLVLVVVILWLLRDKLGALRTNWRTVIPASLGVVIGLAHARFAEHLGVMREFNEIAGIPPGLVTLGLVVAWALFVISKTQPFLERLFPSERGRPNGHRRPRN